MDTIMTGPRFTTFVDVDRPADRIRLVIEISGLVARALIAVDRLFCAGFDWLGERHQRSYERRVLSTMGPRERADIGLGRRDDSDDAKAAFWRD